MSTLRETGEREMIRRMARLLPGREDVRVGIGDDAAVVALEGEGPDLLLTSDAVIEHTHFLPDTDPEQVGRKAMGRVLSDLAAMGGEPLWALLDVAAPPDTPVERLESLCRGAGRLADEYGVAVAGGDTASGPVLEVHVFAVGAVPRGAAVLRSGAKPGDIVCVTGALGGSLGGRHLDFEPRIEQGLWLREGRWAGAMIDVSDGLVTDLSHIAERSGVGAEIEADRIPLSAAAREAKGGRTPLEHALYDGEDFELLFTVPAARYEALATSWEDVFDLPCTAIGRITEAGGRLVIIGSDGRREEAADRGYEHFAE